MPRNLDLTALRSFATVAESGGVTRAAGLLNLTQSAVSMQVKRLEEALDVSLFDRTGRGVTLTAEGEQLLTYATRMLALNDEVWARLTSDVYEGEIRLGAPHDIIHPALPRALKRFSAEFPRVQVTLISEPTRRLRAMFARGEVDAILTTEAECGAGGETLCERPLVWIGAEEGAAWRQRPLPLAFCSSCIFRPGALRALDAAGIDWTLTVETASDNAADAAVAADLGIAASIATGLPMGTELVEHGGLLPDLGVQKINLYLHSGGGLPVTHLAEELRQSYRAIRDGYPRPRSAARVAAE
ncbi:LysR family transcriptional regulator [Wenxinia saemankumensis]|uniref:Transcriptional regulator, LysR family n=1 Tax=Wenxinia saemankumensis TaxID=1447782 RepID=A0A1M6ASY0_9RHOB|nr:LysR family transcriptional regulator [Wenxinia saemankumensis]SHI39428.1 transcriptional regulator, LysR family [Wenxinia saemankumensis]